MLGFGLVKEEGKPVPGGRKSLNRNQNAESWGVFGEWQVVGILAGASEEK